MGNFILEQFALGNVSLETRLMTLTTLKAWLRFLRDNYPNNLAVIDVYTGKYPENQGDEEFINPNADDAFWLKDNMSNETQGNMKSGYNNIIKHFGKVSDSSACFKLKFYTKTEPCDVIDLIYYSNFAELTTED